MAATTPTLAAGPPLPRPRLTPAQRPITIQARDLVPRTILLEWHEAEVAEFFENPAGPLGRTLMAAIGRTVLASAQRRALKRTGRMVDAMYYEVGHDEEVGLYVDVVSPVKSPKGFPYAIVHEDRQPRDRRPHRSLRPALRD